MKHHTLFFSRRAFQYLFFFPDGLLFSRRAFLYLFFFFRRAFLFPTGIPIFILLFPRLLFSRRAFLYVFFFPDGNSYIYSSFPDGLFFSRRALLFPTGSSFPDGLFFSQQAFLFPTGSSFPDRPFLNGGRG